MDSCASACAQVLGQTVGMDSYGQLRVRMRTSFGQTVGMCSVTIAFKWFISFFVVVVFDYDDDDDDDDRCLLMCQLRLVEGEPPNNRGHLPKKVH